jgi:hypothetical protein
VEDEFPVIRLSRQRGGKRTVDFGAQIRIPVTDRFEVKDSTLPYDVIIAYRYSDPRFEVTEVTCRQRHIGDVPVTSEGMRTVPVDRLLRDYLAERVGPWPIHSAKDGKVRFHLSEVAAIYRFAYAIHMPPVAAVAQALGISTKSAGQYVIKARQQRLLPQTSQGKAQA